MKVALPKISTVKSLWLAKRTDEVDYDEYDSCIVAAATLEIAIAQAKTMWADQSPFYCRVIGTTETEPTGVVHSSFCAG
jgi:hypothetical protein